MSWTVGTPVPDPVVWAKGLPANQATRNEKMSVTLTPFILLKSARQHGKFEVGDELQMVAPLKNAPMPGAGDTQSLAVRKTQIAPMQQAPSGWGQVVEVHGVLLPW